MARTAMMKEKRAFWAHCTEAQIVALAYSLLGPDEERIGAADLARRIENHDPLLDLHPTEDQLGRLLTKAGWERCRWRPPGQAPVRGFKRPAAAPPFQGPEIPRLHGFENAAQKRAYDRGVAELTAMAEMAIKVASNLRERKRIARISEWALTRASSLVARDIPKPEEAIATIDAGLSAMMAAKDPNALPDPSTPKMRRPPDPDRRPNAKTRLTPLDRAVLRDIISRHGQGNDGDAYAEAARLLKTEDLDIEALLPHRLVAAIVDGSDWLSGCRIGKRDFARWQRNPLIRFPKPDATIDGLPCWKAITVLRWRRDFLARAELKRTGPVNADPSLVISAAPPPG